MVQILTFKKLDLFYLLHFFKFFKLDIIISFTVATAFFVKIFFCNKKFTHKPLFNFFVSLTKTEKYFSWVAEVQSGASRVADPETGHGKVSGSYGSGSTILRKWRQNGLPRLCTVSR
jgi:hypothetical protein